MRKILKKVATILLATIIAFTMYVPINITAAAEISTLDWSYWKGIDKGINYNGKITDEMINRAKEKEWEAFKEYFLDWYSEFWLELKDYFEEKYPELTASGYFDTYQEDYDEDYKQAYYIAFFSYNYDFIYNEFLSYYFEEFPNFLPMADQETYNPEKLDKYMYAYFYEYLIQNDNFESGGQFNIVGNGDSTKRIATTYADNGYYTFFKLGNKQIDLSRDYYDDEHLGTLKVDKEGVIYEEANFGKITIKATNQNSTTVLVTYKITNNTGKKQTFGLATASDIELGENDDAAVSRYDNSFLITQDDDGIYTCPEDEGGGTYIDKEINATYGAQLSISLSPTPTTTYIGYYENALETDYFNSTERQFYTKADGEDTGLAYSWQGEIENGETKVFTATFGIKKSELITMNFYPKDEEGQYLNPTEDSPIIVMGGGGFKTPVITTESEEGYNIKWYSNKNGTGIGYYPDAWVVAPNKSTDFYEVKKLNTAVPYEDEENDNYGEAEIIGNDNLKESFEEDSKESFDDVKVILEVNEIDETEVEEEKELVEKELKENYKIGGFIDAKLYKLINNTDIIDVTETKKPITLKLTIPTNLINKDSNYRRVYEIIRVHEGTAEVLPTTYDQKTNSLTFETDKFSVYAIAYQDIKEENPNTGDKIILYLVASIVSITGLAVSAIYLKKKHEN